MFGSPRTFHTHFRPNEVQAFWSAQQQPGALGTGAPPPPGMVPCLAVSTGTLVVSSAAGPVVQAAAAGASTGRGRVGGLLPTMMMTTKVLAPASPRRGYLQVLNLLRPQTLVCHDPTYQPATRDSVTSCLRCRQRALWDSFSSLPASTPCR